LIFVAFASRVVGGADMWEELFRRWSDLLFWWLPREREQPQPRKETAPSTRAEPPVAEKAPQARPAEPVTKEPPPARPEEAPKPPTAKAPARPHKAEAPDDLTVIKGIGPVMQDRLRSLGIATYKDLEAADPEALAEKLRAFQPTSAAQVSRWVEAAREQAGKSG
jgi:predicted flap endonuclease-1-like 5' DNA nuclease